MKLIHLSDLHLGKRVNEFSMVEELSAISSTGIPQPIAQLKEKAQRFQQVCSTSEMSKVVLEMLQIQ